MTTSRAEVFSQFPWRIRAYFMLEGEWEVAAPIIQYEIGVVLTRWQRTADREEREERAQRQPQPHWERAGGDCVCERCGGLYYDHPAVDPFIWLTALCDGRIVKL